MVSSRTASALHVAVTGASSGIGEAIAREYAHLGAAVTLVARRRAVLERIASELSAPAFVATCDLSNEVRAADWIDEAEAALGPIDVLVSNAGSLTLGPVAAFDPDEAQRIVAVNLLAPMRLVQKVLPRMVARGHGTIVNVTSLAALVPIPDWIYQAASKAGSATFSETLHAEVAGTGVNVLTVYPGMTDTPMTQAGIDQYAFRGVAPKFLLGDAATLARRLRRAVERRDRRLVYPRLYGVTRYFPILSRWLAERLTPRLQRSTP